MNKRSKFKEHITYYKNGNKKIYEQYLKSKLVTKIVYYENGKTHTKLSYISDDWSRKIYDLKGYVEYEYLPNGELKYFREFGTESYRTSYIETEYENDNKIFRRVFNLKRNLKKLEKFVGFKLYPLWEKSEDNTVTVFEYFNNNTLKSRTVFKNSNNVILKKELYFENGDLKFQQHLLDIVTFEINSYDLLDVGIS